VNDPKPPGAPTEGIYVQVVENGPYRIVGATSGAVVEIVGNEAGESWDYATREELVLRDGSELCRCGHSQKKPLCDNSHEQFDVDVTETATGVPYRDGAEANVGPDATLYDNSLLCAHARFCDAGLEAWGEVEIAGAEHVAAAGRMVARCPGGRLTLIDNASGKDLDEPEEQSISFVEDPLIGASGPIMLRGGITVIGANGVAYEVRNRQALCRCGRSSNKPFCDGSHDPG
jgi:CDGSH-type Zn-finger protein